MGQLLAGPTTDKESGDGERAESGLVYGFSGMQGWRDRMEDAHLAIPSLAEAVGPSCHIGWRETGVFGVMDGHGGEQVARFCQRYLPLALAQGSPDDPATAMSAAFQRMDELLFDPANLDELQTLANDASPVFGTRPASPHCMGCTAVVCCLRPESIVVANAGDSRAVMCRGGAAVPMSEDHKPNLPGELRRIRNAGGCVMEHTIGGQTHYRVNGNLNLSRSIGDLSYKQNFNLMPKDQMICCTPEVRRFGRTSGDEFVVIACDGVWDVLSSQDVVDYIRPKLGDRRDLEQRLRSGRLRLSRIIEGLLDHCLSPNLARTFGLGGDNMTAVLVVFTGGTPPPPDGAWMDSSGAPVPPGNGSAWLCSYR